MKELHKAFKKKIDDVNKIKSYINQQDLFNFSFNYSIPSSKNGLFKYLNFDDIALNGDVEYKKNDSLKLEHTKLQEQYKLFFKKFDEVYTNENYYVGFYLEQE